MPDLFAEYTTDKSFLSIMAPIKPGDKVVVANRYLAPCPFSVYVDHIIAGDAYTDTKIVAAHGGTYPVSVCFAPKPHAIDPRFVLEYTLDDGQAGAFSRYILPDVLEFIKRNRPFDSWTLYARWENAERTIAAG